MAEDQSKNGLLAYLPARFQEDPATGVFLRAFEKILLGRGDGKIELLGLDKQLGLEQIIATLADYFDPMRSPVGFLPWLSQWVALSLRMDIKIEVRRQFIAGTVDRYRQRGTKKSMQSLLETFTQRAVKINDQFDKAPHYFTVELELENVKESDKQEDFKRAIQIAHSVICLEKPAHTRYQLIPVLETMRIGSGWWGLLPDPNRTSYKIQVGKNTRLGRAKWKTTP